MSYDDGVLTVFTSKNGSADGTIPKKVLQERFQSFYEFSTVGMQRYYTALQNNQRVTDAVKIPDRRHISTDDTVQLEDGMYYRVLQVQWITEKNEQKTLLSLERIGDNYE